MSKVQGHYLRRRAQQKNTNLRIFPVFAHRLYCVSWVVEKTALKLSKVCDTDNQDGLIDPGVLIFFFSLLFHKSLDSSLMGNVS